MMMTVINYTTMTLMVVKLNQNIVVCNDSHNPGDDDDCDNDDNDYNDNL